MDSNRNKLLHSLQSNLNYEDTDCCEYSNTKYNDLREYIMSHKSIQFISVICQIVGLRGTTRSKILKNCKDKTLVQNMLSEADECVRESGINEFKNGSFKDIAFSFPEYTLHGVIKTDKWQNILSNPIIYKAGIITKEQYIFAIKSWLKMINFKFNDSDVQRVYDGKMQASIDCAKFPEVLNIIKSQSSVFDSYKDQLNHELNISNFSI